MADKYTMKKSIFEKIVSLPTWIWALIILRLASAVTVLNTVLKVGCLAKAIFTIPCPVCGMTRAFLSLLRLDLSAAMRYNPAFWTVPLICIFGILAASDKKHSKLWIHAFCISTAALIIIWAVRTCLGALV